MNTNRKSFFNSLTTSRTIDTSSSMDALFQQLSRRYLCFISSFFLCFLNATTIAEAQIQPDATLPNNTRVTTNGNTFLIEDGTRVGGNLFHSFQEFSVPTGSEAFFNNATDIQNILSRVTGRNISNIDGLIRANGTANLFLINPNGIILGPNARLNIGGSFISSTANSIKFADTREFSATNPQAPPLLVINVPIGLQYASTPGAIRVEGTGNQGVFPSDGVGLSVAPGHTLALVGGDVTLTGGILTANSGRIEIGGVANGEVSLTPPTPPYQGRATGGWRLGYDKVQQFRDIQLLAQSSLWNPNISSNLEGGIQVQGGRIDLNQSQIAAATQRSQPGADITINASESMEIRGVVENSLPFSSSVVNQVDEQASGSGGQITVTTPQLSIQDGGRIQTISRGSGSAGNVSVNAESIQVSGFTPLKSNLSFEEQNLNSRISSENFAAGAGGNINISTRQLSLLDGGKVETQAWFAATGRGGNINVNATEAIAASGANPFNPDAYTSRRSGIITNTLGIGDGGDITVLTKTLSLFEGGGILALANYIGVGKGGNVTVNATDSISAIGANPFVPEQSSGISTQTTGSGDGGWLRVSTERLTLQDSANVGSYTFVSYDFVSPGNAGDVTVNANQMEVIGFSPNAPDNRSSLASFTFGPGKAGNVTVSTRRLAVRDGGLVASGVVTSFSSSDFSEQTLGAGTGQGGKLSVNASESIEVIGTDPFLFTASTLGTFTLGSGNGGETIINTPQLIVRDGGLVNSGTFAAGNAGKMSINASEIFVSGTAANGAPAEISANALILNQDARQAFFLPEFPTGNTGEVTINTGRLTVTNRGRVSVQHDGTGNAGTLEINASNVFLNRGGSIRATTQSGDGGDITLKVHDFLLLQKKSTISSSAGQRRAAGNGGNIDINAGFVVAVPKENSDITANAFEGRGGNINITTNAIYGLQFRNQQTPLSDITASSKFGIDGTVNLNILNLDPTRGLTQLPSALTDPTDQIVAGCLADRGASFLVTGRGGLPEDPTATLRGQVVMQDFRVNAVGSVNRLRRSPVALPLGRSPNLTHRKDKEHQQNLRANSPSSPIIEAQGWVVDKQGNVELVANLLQKSRNSRKNEIDCTQLKP